MDAKTYAVALFLTGLAVKLLLVPAYYSTDFEVHRNWLAITASLPLEKWYYADRSEWTLDYPPLFAFLEYALTAPARLFDAAMLEVENLNHATFATVLFQRLSAMATEALFLAGVVALLPGERALQALTFLNPAILFVDHVHFQYNAVLTGVQLLSLAAARSGRDLAAAALFAALLALKHIYLYAAPAYFVYLLRHYCCGPPPRQTFSLRRFAALAAVTAVALGGPFVPFARHLPQILTRLFPFQRGLTHAYWAPNAWALYSACDRVLLAVYKHILPRVRAAGLAHASLTRGLVGDAAFAVLPAVPPAATAALFLAAAAPALVWLWRRPTPLLFHLVVVQTAFAAFVFGWHVHEKAILVVLMPLAGLLAAKPPAVAARAASVLVTLAVAGCYALFPLLFHAQEEPTRVLILVLWLLLALPVLHARRSAAPSTGIVRWVELAYNLGFVPLHLCANYVFPTVVPHYAFLGLLLTSTYAALGVVASFVRLYGLTYYVYAHVE